MSGESGVVKDAPIVMKSAVRSALGDMCLFLFLQIYKPDRLTPAIPPSSVVLFTLHPLGFRSGQTTKLFPLMLSPAEKQL